MNDKKTTRRRFLVASIAFSGCAFGTMGASMLRISATWAESRGNVDRETLNAMIRMARMLFPHDVLSDEIYGDVLDSALSGAATDPSFAESLNAAEKALDAARPGNWIDLDESEQLAAMHDVEGMGFFAADVGHEANTTRIVFVRWVVETLLRRESEILHEKTDFGLGSDSPFRERATAGELAPSSSFEYRRMC